MRLTSFISALLTTGLRKPGTANIPAPASTAPMSESDNAVILFYFLS
jgi:hypothetical protein